MIADVSYYVRPDGASDKEAINRGARYTSVTSCPNAAEVLSNGLCSL
ncbi:hypothetical protein O9929_01290 [Vibrio lentus]|nr:hypothetical protein [Vibrio lentus]